jgi:fibronectin-binding autotransporter adhesin
MFKLHRHHLPAKVIARRSRRIRRILALEGLEERVVLSATIYTVDLTTDNGPTSAGSGSGTTGDLRYVISQADADSNSAGVIIEFDPTVFAQAQTIALSSSLGTLDLTDTAGPMQIDGPTAGVTISGGNAVGVFQVASGVTASLSGLTITGGSTAGAGGGLFNGGTATLTDCTIAGNSGANDGGGLFNQGTLTLTGCAISGNSGAIGGGGLANDGTATLTGCTISGNSAGEAGGGLFNDII